MPKHLAEWSHANTAWEDPTATPCFCGHLTPYSETLPRSGMTRNGQLYARPTSAHPTGDSGSLSLPTPRATLGGSATETVAKLPTQKAGDADWGLPRTSGRPPEKSTHLATRLAYTLPTPSANIAANGGSQHPDKRRAGGHQPSIEDVAEHTTDWGPYESAIRRWEQALDRPAPAPTEPGKTRPRLSPRFVEWMMGLPDGHVTATATTRTQQLKALGNGVVPQQAAAAIRANLTNGPTV